VATHGKKKTDEALILALACGTPVETAAAKSGVSERTVYRRLKEPEFRRRVQTTRAEMVERAASMLTAASMQAVKTLLALQETSAPPAVRLGAARAILDISIRYREITELQERLTAVEQQLAHGRPPAAEESAA
jgi:hypothetical protein